MKIVVAPDSFKESLTASEAADAVEEGFRQVFPEAEGETAHVRSEGKGLSIHCSAPLTGKSSKRRSPDRSGEKWKVFMV